MNRIGFDGLTIMVINCKMMLLTCVKDLLLQVTAWFFPLLLKITLTNV